MTVCKRNVKFLKLFAVNLFWLVCLKNMQKQINKKPLQFPDVILVEMGDFSLKALLLFNKSGLLICR